jgi:hypothetical protein
MDLISAPFIGALVAHTAFWVLLVIGFISKTLTTLGTAVFVLLWGIGYIVLPRLAFWTAPLVTSWVAILDITLVFIVFKGDVRLT